MPTKAHRPYITRVLNEVTPLAASCPNHIYVSTGLLDLLEREDELAALLAIAIARDANNVLYEDFAAAKTRANAAVALGLIGLIAGLAIGSPLVGPTPAATQGATTITWQMVQQQAVQQGTAAAVAVSSTLMSSRINSAPATPRALGAATYRLSPFTGASKRSGPIGSVLVTEMWLGYKENQEQDAIPLAIAYLKHGNYDPAALAATLAKLIPKREEYISKGYRSSLLTASPGLERRMEHAKAAAGSRD